MCFVAQDQLKWMSYKKPKQNSCNIQEGSLSEELGSLSSMDTVALTVFGVVSVPSVVLRVKLTLNSVELPMGLL